MSSRSTSECPSCGSADVARLYLGSLHVDSCECRACRAQWEEDRERAELRSPLSRSAGTSTRPKR
jgi:hypothetical protein